MDRNFEIILGQSLTLKIANSMKALSFLLNLTLHDISKLNKSRELDFCMQSQTLWSLKISWRNGPAQGHHDPAWLKNLQIVNEIL